MLLTLLSLKIGGVRLNPALPTFLSPGVEGMLVSGFKVTAVDATSRSVVGFLDWGGAVLANASHAKEFNGQCNNRNFQRAILLASPLHSLPPSR